MSMLKEAFEAGKFGVTAEMAPPKGYDFSEQLEAAKLLNGKVHGVNVTDMQSASLKASSLGLCIALKNAGIEPILQMTGRDRNRMAIMGDILSAAAFGIDTMLALTGDHPVVGDCPESKPVYDLDSVGILKMLTKMEQTNCDCGGNEIAGGAPKFYKGASVTPVYDPIELQINKLRQKVENGAEYIQTQGIFDLETFKRFLDKVWNLAETAADSEDLTPANEAILHKTIKKVTDDIDTLKMNTAIAAMMTAVNEMTANGVTRGDLGILLRLLNPFAPHITEELWEQLGFAAKTGKMCCQAEWPVYDAAKTVASSVEMAIQVNGKMKGTVTVAVDSDEETVKAAALSVDKVQKATEGMQIVKTILVKNRLINLIVKPR